MRQEPEKQELTLPRPVPPVRRRRVRLGDAVHAIAHPVARVIDRVVGTGLQHCQGCAERRDRWNRLGGG